MYQTQNGNSTNQVTFRAKARETAASIIDQKYRIIIDTSALLAQGAVRTLGGDLLAAYNSTDYQATVSSRSIDHLKHLAAKQGRKQIVARLGLQTLETLSNAGHLVDAKDPYPTSGDPYDVQQLLAERFIQFQMKWRMCLITQDESLAKQVLINANTAMINQKLNVVVYKVTPEGLEEWQVNDQTSHLYLAIPPLEEIVRQFIIIPDTSALMLTNRTNESLIGTTFFNDVLLPLLRRHEKSLVVPERVRRELQKHQNCNSQYRRNQAGAAAKVLAHYEEAHCLSWVSDADELSGAGSTFADPVFIQSVIRFQNRYNLCIITQDTELAKTLLANRNNSCKNHLLLARLHQGGKLMAWEDFLDKGKKRTTNNKNPKTITQPKNLPDDQHLKNYSKHSSAQPIFNKTKRIPKNKQSSIKPFKTFIQPEPENPTPIFLNELPNEDTTVQSTQIGPVKILSRIAEGGEGTVYETDQPDIVCKIYHRDQLTHSRELKIDLMLSKEVKLHNICWPIDKVTNHDGTFVGFLMSRVNGQALSITVFAKPLLIKKFPHWHRSELISLSITILKTIQQLHKINVLIGDINPQNILVESNKKIWIVDTDSFQIEGYPCPVGTDSFTPPERQGHNYTKFLRTLDDELFAITTLIFRILFVGKAPYSSEGGGEASENIRHHRFAYGKTAEGRPPAGTWQFIWSHLHLGLKEIFTSVFQEDKRIPVGSIIRQLERAQKDISQGHSNNELFPDKPYFSKGKTVEMFCEDCPPDENLHQVGSFHYETLRQNGKNFVCTTCRAQRKLSRLTNTRNVPCGRMVSEHCEGEFTISLEKLKKLQRIGKQPWCRTCRNQIFSNPRVRNSRYQSESLCFVATATYQSESAPQVIFLRHFRDHVLMQHISGRIFIGTYHYVGPWLARCVIACPPLRTLSRWILDRIVKWLPPSL